ncbi:hypothetical protein [Streptomyces sp. RKAG337]|uniref:hypothetical protein n=1 Tax=Streptomyces sp. RKAG337 TaxID=2893404 RepID=UPI002033F956|nr:hypothetical protein [Streptomyces sp. RKAG337]MCM2430954.1 hypothetical protein [Streptomyces sp. RKAG337]
MSDRSSLQLCVYSVGEDDRAAVLEAIDEEGMELVLGGKGDDPASLALGQRYRVDETALSQANDLLVTLLQRAPSAAFKLWQDPEGPHDGQFVAHFPGVGTYESGCDADGTPQISVAEIIARLTAAPAGTVVHEWLDGEGTRSWASRCSPPSRATSSTTAGEAAPAQPTPLSARLQEKTPMTSTEPAARPSTVVWDDYPLRCSDDPVKTDLELIHTTCGRRLCDVEHDDTLPALAGMVTEHAARCTTGWVGR